MDIRFLKHSHTIFTCALTVQIVGLLFSIALSSIAFAFSSVFFGVLAFTHRKEALASNGLEWFVFAYITSVAAMVLFAMYPMEALSNSRRVLLLLVLYFVPLAFSSIQSIRMLVFALLAATAFESVVDIGVYYFSGYERLGFFQHYMTSAGIKMFILLLTLPLLFERDIPLWWKALLGVAGAVVFFALILTQTRSSWLAFLVGALFLGLIRYRKILAGLTVVLILFFLLAPSGIMMRVRTMFQTQQGEVQQSTVQSNQTRLRMWKTGWRIFLDHPVVGVGDGDMGRIYRLYVPDAVKDEGGHLHNTYVHILASHGALGFLAVIILFGSIAWFEWKTYWRNRNRANSGLLLGTLAALLGFLANGMAEYNFGDHEILVLLWTSVGIAIVLGRNFKGTAADFTTSFGG